MVVVDHNTLTMIQSGVSPILSDSSSSASSLCRLLVAAWTCGVRVG